MKLFKKILSVLSLAIVLLVVACGSDVSINVEGKMDIAVYKTSITIETTFVDSDDMLANEKVKCHVAVFNSEDDEINRKNVEIDVETMTGKAFDITNLEANTGYVVKLVASLDGEQKTLNTQSITTVNNGETEDDPISISTIDDLKAMSKVSEAYYVLANDIDLGNESLSAIFNASNPFDGHLDGAGYSISNVTLDIDSTYSGIFGYLKGAEIKNLNINSVKFEATRGERYIGALAGYAENSTITNVNVNGVTVIYTGQTSKTANIGGLVGIANDCEIADSHVNGLAISLEKSRLKVYVGGFVGQNTNSKIVDSSVEGTMNITIGYTSNKNGFTYAGGFVGLNESAKGINNSYSKVNITVGEVDSYTGKSSHSTYVGGFVGGNAHTIARISDCAAIGDIVLNNYLGNSVYVGGFFGELVYASALTNCVYKSTNEGIKLGFVDAEEENKDCSSRNIYVSLVGTYDNKVVLTNVFAYSDCLTYSPEGTGVNVVAGNVSQDLTGFSDTIKNLFN